VVVLVEEGAVILWLLSDAVALNDKLINEYGAVVGETEWPEKTCTISVCPPQIPHDLTWT
jgi:hypothetical protein